MLVVKVIYLCRRKTFQLQQNEDSYQNTETNEPVIADHSSSGNISLHEQMSDKPERQSRMSSMKAKSVDKTEEMPPKKDTKGLSSTIGKKSSANRANAGHDDVPITKKKTEDRADKMLTKRDSKLTAVVPKTTRSPRVCIILKLLQFVFVEKF